MSIHYKADAIRALLAAGLTNSAISIQLHVERKVIARIRDELGIPNVPKKMASVEARWQQLALPTADGHMEWTGPVTGPARTPTLRYDGVIHTAGRVAYRIHNGTDPAGRAQPGCGVRHCVAPAHQLDTAQHRPVRKPHVRYASPEAKFAALVRPADGGHLDWTGPRTSQGLAIIPWNTRNLMASRVSFRARYGREPEGPVTVACEHPGCLLGDHLDDAVARRAHRAAYAALGL